MNYVVILDIEGSKSYLDVDEQQRIQLPDLTKSGYVLDGWYTDKHMTVRYDLSTPVIGNLILYAKYELERVNTLFHLPDFYRDIPELQAICAGYDALFRELYEIIDQSKLDIFVDTMNLNALYRWEEIVNENHDGTIADRRFRLKLRMFNELPYTRCHLEDIISLFVPRDQFVLRIDTTMKSVDLLIAYHSENQAKSLYNFMCRVTPASMLMSVARLENIYDDISQFTYQELQDKALTYFEMLTDHRLRRGNTE